MALFRLVCYINSTAASAPTGCVGDDPMSLHLQLHESPDFADGMNSSYSVPGAILALVGPRSFFPIMAKTAEHGCVGDPISAIATASGDVTTVVLTPYRYDVFELHTRHPPHSSQM